MDLKEIELKRIIIDENNPEQVIVLKEKKTGKTFPVVIGINEVAAIKMELGHVKPPRPLTHDLLKEIINTLGGTLEKVVIDAVKNNTFYAKLHFLKSQGASVVIDARPSDSIVLALKMHAPLFATQEVLDKVGKE